jgi:hypothetical protein
VNSVLVVNGQGLKETGKLSRFQLVSWVETPLAIFRIPQKRIGRKQKAVFGDGKEAAL